MTPEFVMGKPGAFLHRFQWLDDSLVGEFSKEWNWLTTEYEVNYNAKLLHYTLGTPCFKDYWNCDMADEWHSTHARTQQGLMV